MTETDRRSFMVQSAGAVVGMALLPDLTFAAPRQSAKRSVAVIGAGRQGRAIMGELQKIEGITVAALCDVDASRLRSGLRRVRGAKGHDDHRKLLDGEKDIDAVFVATPTHTHKDVALDCLAAGRHVYCEAPLAHTVEDCRALASAARSAKTVFATGLQGRSNPVYKLARTFFRSDSVRDVVSMRCQENKKRSWRTPASTPEREKALNWRLDPELSLGLAGELGTNQFDVIHWFRRKYPRSVRGHGTIRLHDDGREIYDTVNCDFKFEDGVSLAYGATLANSYGGRYELLHGTNAAIKLSWSHGWMFKEADAPTQGWEVYANRQQFHNDEGITLIAEATKLSEQGKLQDGVGLPHPSLYYSVSDFLTAIAEKKDPVCSADEGMRASIVGILANQAIVTGTEVSIDENLLKGS